MTLRNLEAGDGDDRGEHEADTEPLPSGQSLAEDEVAGGQSEHGDEVDEHAGEEREREDERGGLLE